ncbi:hypothetical protein [Orrella daihaiensis]|uniref:Uncharacterized protein n=1 Tax=Orrella daihaiensis TaxID=2782176 RepID=A0ABY4ALY3_9BURK|nr:hypothetical protein [Orrella daihaiensis]UOD51321.1 hypothetical protein DHf2319_05645 [Orrella daihaiensis]
MGDMQEIQLLLVQTQTVAAQLAFQMCASFGLALAWLVVALGLVRHSAAPAWRGLFALIARLGVALGLLWLVVLSIAWPPLLERTGNVLGPMVAGLAAISILTEVLAARLARSTHPRFKAVAHGLTALGMSLALGLALLLQAWLLDPTGVALVDGRYQIIEWSQMFDSRWFMQGLLAAVFGAVLLLAAWLQAPGARERLTVLALPDDWQRALSALGIAALLGLMWLVSRSVGAELNPVTQTTQTLYEALLSGSGHWPLRLLFVLWALTLAGLVSRLAASTRTSVAAARLLKLSLFAAPLMWLLVYWQLFGKANLSQLAGLPVKDLVSMQPLVALGFGLVLVVMVLGAAVWLLWRYINRLDELARANTAMEAT